MARRQNAGAVARAIRLAAKNPSVKTNACSITSAVPRLDKRIPSIPLRQIYPLPKFSTGPGMIAVLSLAGMTGTPAIDDF
jgi:hypothetical protein